MHVQSDQDFTLLQAQFAIWRRRFPMFVHDVAQVEKIVDYHIQAHSRIMVKYRQNKSRSWLTAAQLEIDAINRVVATVEKMELMAMLSRG